MTGSSTRDVHARLRRGHLRMYELLVGARATVPELLERAIALVEQASRPEATGCPERICAYDHLISVYEKVDHPGYAPEIVSICEQLAREVAPDRQCHYCIANQRIAALRELGEHGQAARACARGVTELRALARSAGPAPFWLRHHLVAMLQQTAMTHADAGRLDAARAALEATGVHEPRALSTVMCARHYDVIVAVELAAGNRSGAAALATEALEHLPPHLHAAGRIATRVAGAFARTGRHADSLVWFRRAAIVADYLQAPRLQVEAHLGIARALIGLGEVREASTHVTTAREQLGGLRSRDLARSIAALTVRIRTIPNHSR